MQLAIDNETVSITNKVQGNDERIHEIRIVWTRGSDSFHVYLDGEEVTNFTSHIEESREAIDRMFPRLVDPQLIPWNCEEHHKLFARAKG